MRLLGNLLWHIPFLGFVTAGVTWLLGLLLTMLVIPAPIGLGCMELGKFLFLPFGREMISGTVLKDTRHPKWKAYSTVIMVLWLPIGLVLAAFATLQVVSLFLSILGIPAAIVLAKSLPTYLNPVNKKCVPSEVAEEIRRRRGVEGAAAYLGEEA
ncbi:YccF domain-containing protein [Desulfohalovibrio reitneri]|uniref:YccF domain-containing protein n=1 Tax=Desulfohalovibrio reitneri TaxID=1307759 RepID=UPI0006901F1E|nr:YccF domain-containing protein [Desulfohalovibrio reitneri]